MEGFGISVRGVSGELRKGYQVAARLGAWSLEKASEVVTAQASDIKPFWLNQPGPLSLSLTLGRRQWVWTSVELISQDTPLLIRVVGAPETR